jgi:HEAT repeat protein/cyclophilin family peptidyl-prolyl cis-trans isomerase
MLSHRWCLVGLLATGCASAPKPAAVVVVPYEEQLANILWLEDRRVLREEVPAPPPAPAAKEKQPLVAAAPPPDLRTLATDGDARLRRRAVLAIGRVGLADGVAPLVAALKDPEPAVRATAAFGLGLIGDASAAAPLVAALDDPDPRVQGRAAEALGLIGDGARSAADAIGRMVSTRLAAGGFPSAPADETSADSPEVRAVRLGLYALARLKAYEPLAAAVLDAQGRPRLRWWPVAYALQRAGDARAAPALAALVMDPNQYTAGFAARGLGELKPPAALDSLLPLIERPSSPMVTAMAIRAVEQIADPRAAPALLKLLDDRNAPPNLRLAAVGALGATKAPEAYDPLLDYVQDPWPAMRAATIGALAATNPTDFLIVLSTLEPDTEWSVRAALAGALGRLSIEEAWPRLEALLTDSDVRVVPAALRAAVSLKHPNAAGLILKHLSHKDMIVRTTAAALVGELKLASAASPLVEAYARGKGDAGYSARAAALDALVKIDPPAARATLLDALGDSDWALRLRASQLLKEVEPAASVTEIRPAPVARSRADYGERNLIAPQYSPTAYVETERGTIQLLLDVVDAPLTTANFTALARKGFFDGVRIHRVVPNFVVQDGDPRGDGEGGPGYTIRDELTPFPYVRGTVGMALDWEDTGGGQWFITHSPQPHLDGRYTVFGRVVDGMNVVDQLQVGDVIKRVRVWDGVTPLETSN